jgi:AcrR family transcriptional regulator
VLGAAARLLEEEGYGALTMEGIARGAGVSKQTIYRWWPSKAAILLEALNEVAEAVAPAPDAGSLEADLRPFLRWSVGGGRGRNGRVLAAVMAAAQLDEDFGAAFRRGFLRRRREVLRQILERGRERGEVALSVDLDFVVELVFGALWYRILSRNAPLNGQFADRLTDAVLELATAATRSAAR